MAVCVLVFIAQLVSHEVNRSLIYYPYITEFEPWRMVTSMFAHSTNSFTHILLNMFSLFIIGPPLEATLGRWRFFSLYMLSGLGGSVAVLLLAPGVGVVGASGAIFGMLGAFLIIQRSFGGRNGFIIGVIALNLVLGFVIPNISWQAHVGGLVAGSIAAYVLLKTKGPRKRNRQILLLIGVFVGLVILTFVGIELMNMRFR